MTELLLDYDAPTPPPDLLRRLQRVAWYFGTTVGVVECRKTRRGWHVIAKLRSITLPPLAVVAAQAILGSDPQRELFNLVRASRLEAAPTFWHSRHNVLYRAKSKERQL